MIRNCLFFLTAYLCLSATTPIKYRAEIKSADHFLLQHQPIIDKISATFSFDQKEVLAIVYPELLRYNLFRDFFETTFLEQLYVKGGAQLADFSIGPFQMKPSFIESLEFHIQHAPALQKDFGFITQYEHLYESAIRNERLQRLQSFEWQVKYAFCFYAIIQDCYGGLGFKNKAAQLQFFATAYNFGFDRPLADIRSWMEVAAFPYGKKIGLEQVTYSSLTLHYFHRCIP